jgi:hypothetical protein
MSKQLTPELIAMRTKCDKLEKIKNLNLWGNDLGDVSVIKQLQGLEVLSLAVNKIRTLKDFSKLKSLRELYLRKNLISSIDELKHLTKCSNLQILSISENPISEIPNYRLMILRLLPNLVKLDDKLVSEEEIKMAMEEDYSNDESDLSENEVLNYSNKVEDNNEGEFNVNMITKLNNEKSTMDKFISSDKKNEWKNDKKMKFQRNYTVENINEYNHLKKEEPKLKKYHSKMNIPYNDDNYPNINEDTHNIITNNERKILPIKENDNVFKSILLLINELNNVELEVLKEAINNKLKNK